MVQGEYRLATGRPKRVKLPKTMAVIKPRIKAPAVMSMSSDAPRPATSTQPASVSTTAVTLARVRGSRHRSQAMSVTNEGEK